MRRGKLNQNGKCLASEGVAVEEELIENDAHREDISLCIICRGREKNFRCLVRKRGRKREGEKG
jgi:hypothetical protein